MNLRLFPLFLSSCSLLWADPFSDPTPHLRIDTEMHLGAINRISVDQAESLLVTASNDKTVKIWHLDKQRLGELQRTIRLPILPENSNAGKAFAVTLSPDGSLIAVGGYLGSVSLYQTDTGMLVHQIGPMPAVVNHLSFSPDGQFLATGLLQGHGMRIDQIINTEKGLQSKLVFSDEDYGETRCAWIDWSPSSKSESFRLAATGWDGLLRVYERQDGQAFQRVTALDVTPLGGKEPMGCAFHPQKDQIAVGFYWSPFVEVFDLENDRLQHAFSADVKGLERPNLAAVSWSKDGERLFAAGEFAEQEAGDRTKVMVWEEGGREKRVTWNGTSDSITQIVPLKTGNLVIGAHGPTWKILKGNGETAFQRTAPTGDIRGAAVRGTFQLSPS
ncbi:MAG: hypothetical protein AAGJ31_14625, partial [Verrucomicrobiota bacterium]